MAATYEPIATTTLSTNTTTVSFTSISGSFTDIRLIVVPFSTSNGMNYRLRLNGDSGSNYSYTNLRGGPSTGSGRQSNITFFDNLSAGVYTSTPHTYIYDFFNYSNNTTNKTGLSRFGEMGGDYVSTTALLWRDTSAIDEISLEAITNQFASGSTFTLYGIKAA